MKKYFLILYIAVSTAFGAGAQVIPALHDIPKNDPGLQFGIQFTAEAEKKFNRDFKASIGIEYRMQDYFLYDKQYRFFADAEYKFSKKLSLVGGYTYIGRRKEGDRLAVRHRFEAGPQESIKLNKKFKLIFTEKLVWTHRAGYINKYQNARDDIALKTKAKLQYSPWKICSFFTYFELRTTFREPNLRNLYYDSSLRQFTDEGGSPVGRPGWFLEGFDKIRINRIRIGLGADFKPFPHHKIRFTALYDHDQELDIDCDRHGTVIKTLVYDRRHMLYGRLGYVFSF